MKEYIRALLQRHIRGAALLDTSILLLYFVGSFDEEEIPKFKRTKMFAVEDYSTLLNLLDHFDKIVTTPNILTEVNSLSGQLPDYLKAGYFEIFARGIARLDEHYFPSDSISQMEEFRRFGLTDAGIFRLAKDNYLVITTDLPLSQYLQDKGVDVLNFNHIRLIGWK